MDSLLDRAVVAIDDGYFPHEYKSLKGPAPIVGVLGWRESIVKVLVRYTLVDCPNITRVLYSLFKNLTSGYLIDVNAILTHNIIMSGFSIFDPDNLYRSLNKPVIIVFDHDLNLDRIRRALEKNFIDHEYRFRIIASNYRESHTVITRVGRVRVRCVGLDIDLCIDIVTKNQTRHPMPQPLKHADIIASSIGRLITRSSITPPNIICDPGYK